MIGHRFKCADKDEICANSDVCVAHSRLFGGLGGRKVAAEKRCGRFAAGLRAARSSVFAVPLVLQPLSVA
jgi:hypothetical protein